MLGGGSASGKSSAVPLLTEMGYIPANSTHIDPDEVMGMLPGYQAAVAQRDPCAATTYHEVSSTYAKRLLDDALALRYHIVYDGTMSSYNSSVASINKGLQKGYRVAMAGVFCPTAEAAHRSIVRANATGRYVPLSIIFSSHHGYAQNFMPYASLLNASYLFDTTTPAGGQGTQPLRTVFRTLASGSPTFEINWSSLSRLVDEARLTMDDLQASLSPADEAAYKSLAARCGLPPDGTPLPFPAWAWVIIVVGVALLCASATFLGGCLVGCRWKRHPGTTESPSAPLL
eukprot:GAFH01002469.1.p1 GENE.GAFH01002469.1~~GAFH01002469.1.p1  ORF type:complete len:322 (-),score=37.41 GAFH01002469.1:200-1060(-)